MYNDVLKIKFQCVKKYQGMLTGMPDEPNMERNTKTLTLASTSRISRGANQGTKLLVGIIHLLSIIFSLFFSVFALLQNNGSDIYFSYAVCKYT